MSALTVALLDEAIAAHGGREQWQRATELCVKVSAGGLAFSAKLQPRVLRNLEARVSTDRQRVVLTPFPRGGHRGVFDQGAVRIESVEGGLVKQRHDARAQLRRVRRLVWWDHLDILYFAGSALSTYMAMPFVFARPDFRVRELDAWTERGEVWRRLGVTFPPGYHTHSTEQVFYVAQDGLIRRHDYTAEEFGTWAKSAHYWFDNRDFDGLVVPTRRRVFLRREDNRPRPHPLLVWIDVAELRR